MARTTTTYAATPVHCPGVPTLHIPAHEADAAGFSVNRKRPNGLAVLCRACDSAYQRVWRKAKAAGMTVPVYLATDPALALPAQPTAQRRKPVKDDAGVTIAYVVVDGTAAQEAEHAALDAAIEAAGGVATQDAQQLLAAAAAAEAEAKRAAKREMARLAKQRQRARAKEAQPSVVA